MRVMSRYAFLYFEARSFVQLNSSTTFRSATANGLALAEAERKAKVRRPPVDTLADTLGTRATSRLPSEDRRR